jgi:hypothetical protein
VQPFYRRTGKGRWSWDKIVARARCHWRIVARPSGIDGHVTLALGMGGFEAGEGDSAAGLSRPVEVLPFGVARWQASPARWPAAAAPRQGQNKGGRERRVKEERETVRVK